ncbi:hypothetical protein pclt_cds_308 [Pandoravirus celtis]|uniref:Uncharacterized protein n=1 Tax=Pandoravirus celtis TaxID=2568002 RepID=A0A4D6EGG6_9VIRU|nr:hypothetical protein pclt_cds_308 [Pandoravirus celtis]
MPTSKASTRRVAVGSVGNSLVGFFLATMGVPPSPSLVLLGALRARLGGGLDSGAFSEAGGGAPRLRIVFSFFFQRFLSFLLTPLCLVWEPRDLFFHRRGHRRARASTCRAGPVPKRPTTTTFSSVGVIEPMPVFLLLQHRRDSDNTVEPSPSPTGRRQERTPRQESPNKGMKTKQTIKKGG